MRIDFQSYDQAREVERILDSMSILLELAKENKDNVLFLIPVFDRLHRSVNVTSNALEMLMAEAMLDIASGDALKALVDAEPYVTYQTEVDEMIKSLLRTEDQNAQAERRNNQKD